MCGSFGYIPDGLSAAWEKAPGWLVKAGSHELWRNLLSNDALPEAPGGLLNLPRLRLQCSFHLSLYQHGSGAHMRHPRQRATSANAPAMSGLLGGAGWWDPAGPMRQAAVLDVRPVGSMVGTPTMLQRRPGVQQLLQLQLLCTGLDVHDDTHLTCKEGEWLAQLRDKPQIACRYINK